MSHDPCLPPMNEMERCVLEMFLAGEDPLLDVLRTQLEMATVTRRVCNSAGFDTYFSVAEDAPRATGFKRFALADVYAEVEDLEHAAGFLLWVIDGAIDCLECFIVDDEWPEPATLRHAFYVRPIEPGSGSLVNSESRDLPWAIKGFLQ